MIEPLIDHLVSERKGPTPNDLDAVPRVGDLASCKAPAFAISIVSDHRSNVLPQQFCSIHAILPAMFRELVAPYSVFMRTKPTASSRLSRRCAEVPILGPVQIKDVLGRHFELPEWQLRVGLRRWQI